MMKFRYKVIYGLGMSKRYQLKDEKYTGLQKLQVGVLRFLGKFTTTPKVCKMWEKASSKYQGQKTGWSYACNNAIDETCFIVRICMRTQITVSLKEESSRYRQAMMKN